MSSLVRSMMQRLGSPLGAVCQDPAHTKAPKGIPDPLMRSLFVMVSRAERFDPAVPRTSTLDQLHWCTYHALLASFLSYRAKHRCPDDVVGGGGQCAVDHEQRVRGLAGVVAQHSAGSAPVEYKVRALCYSKLSPTTLLRLGNTLYVACRGTSSVQEAMADLQMGLTEVDADVPLPRPAQVHTGFLRAFKWQETEVFDKIDAEPGEPTVVFCGHSLGGAVAQLLGLAYAARRRRAGCVEYVSTVVTFGCPRIGDVALGERLYDLIDHRRVFVEDDPVAGMPSATISELRMSGQAATYDNHTAQEHWRLPLGRRAEPSGPAEPTVTSALLCARFRKRHALTTYAATLVDHNGACWTMQNAAARRRARA